MRTKALIVIPARYDSTRFPGKVLKEIAGRPMLDWVYDIACCSDASDVFVASGDDIVEDFCRQRAICFYKTTGDHINGSSRVAEVVRDGYANVYHDYWCVINLQADEPLVNVEDLNNMIRFMVDHPNADITTLYRPIEDEKHPDVYSQDVCKVAQTASGRALYFSRAPISSDRHIGIYAYRPSVLLKLQTLAPSNNELRERLEQLRALEYGYRIECLFAHDEYIGVDNPSDAYRVADILKRRRAEWQ